MDAVGLTSEQAEKSRQKHGSNALTVIEGESFWSKLKNNLGDPMIKILCVALAINIIFVFLGQTEWYESVGIAAAVIIATFVSTYSEYKNEGAFQKLQEEASRIICKVYRDNEIVELHIDEIVCGDNVILQSGDKVPADGYVFDGALSVDQSVLNGEAKEAKKTPAPQGYNPDKKSTDFLTASDLFRGSIVCSGNAVMIVSSVGDSTVYGGIASELQEEDDRESPLKVKLSDLANGISRFGYIGGIAIALAYLFKAIVIANGFDPSAITSYCSNWMTLVNDIVEAVMLAVIIIVMAVPEGLPLMIALVSSMNMGKMLKDNVLVRDINGIETAGSLNILFCDKTGTITKGKLEVVSFIDGCSTQYKSISEVPQTIRNEFISNTCLNSEALLTGHGNERKAIGGNATERSLLNFTSESAIEKTHVYAEIPFTSARKFSAVQPTQDNLTYVKGAPEIVLSSCDSIIDASGRSVPINLDSINQTIDALAKKSIRVLAFAKCQASIDKDEISSKSGWTLIGLVGIRDDIRPESAEAIKETKSAGIQVVMITGDRIDTAKAIAKEAGIVQSDSDIILTSAELNSMSDDEIAKKMRDIRVVARALPSDKSRLVKIAQSMNLVAGMTGDGVNDSTALKKADIGFAMGSGTEVAKEAAEIVILDDNFSSIEKAILYGRTIFNSIRKFIIYQLTINVSAVIIAFVFPLLGMGNPLTITQILWINLIMDTLAALALGGEPALRRYMQEKPKKRNEKIVNAYMWSAILTGALWTFVLSVIFLLTPQVHSIFRESASGEFLMTGYFCFFVFTSIFNAFNARTEKLNLFDNIRSNKGFLKIILLITLVQVLMTYFGSVIFRCYGLNAIEWICVLLFAISIIPIDLLRKAYWKVKSNQNSSIHKSDI